MSNVSSNGLLNTHQPLNTDNHVYDVTAWSEGNAYEDIGAVINSIIAHVKAKQNRAEHGEGLEEGRPGAVIYIPPGDYHLKTQIVVDISYLKIEGSGHGFISSSIRFNTEPEALAKYVDLWPGGSRILVDLQVKPCGNEREQLEQGAAILVKRDALPRISSVEFCGFCIDGLHFTEKDGTLSENTYLNGKTGIMVCSANDSFCIRDMGFIYLEHGLTIYHADALTVDNNFIVECGNCLELRGSGQASKVSNNLMGAGYNGYSIFAENFGGLLISSNNIFPRGRSIIHLCNVARSNITSNRLHSFYSGMLILEGGCSENLISSNHFLREHEPWAPMQEYDNGLTDDFGLIRIEGSNNSFIANHISNSIAPEFLKFSQDAVVKPVILRIVKGHGNYIAHNHLVVTNPAAIHKNDAAASECFATQVESILSVGQLQPLDDVIELQVDEAAEGNTILFSSYAEKSKLNLQQNAFVALPVLPKH